MSTKTKTTTAPVDFDNFEGFDEGEEEAKPSGTYYHVENAASGRAKCKKCKEAIGKGELRIATSKFYRFAMKCGVSMLLYFVGSVPEQ
jgi:hypothetical protein